MNEVLRIYVNGASGRMGTRIAALIAQDQRYQQVEKLKKASVVIDFSHPDALAEMLQLLTVQPLPLVSGTTGLDPEIHASMRKASEVMPVIYAENFSVGITLCEVLTQMAARALPDYDVAVSEVHHRHKLDAPSGTALLLGRSIAESVGREPAYTSIRAGEIVGDHTVLFAGTGERIEITHQAASRDIFADGALRAAGWLRKQNPGLYNMQDVLALR